MEGFEKDLKMNLFEWWIGYSLVSRIARQQACDEIQQAQLRQELQQKWAQNPQPYRRHHRHKHQFTQPKKGLTFGKILQYLGLIFGGLILHFMWKIIFE